MNTSEKLTPTHPPESSVKIINLLRQNPEMSIPELSDAIGITTRAIEKSIQKLQDSGQLKRVGPARGGHWEVIEQE